MLFFAAAVLAKDLVSCIGKTKRVYEVLNRNRPLTLVMIWSPWPGNRGAKRI